MIYFVQAEIGGPVKVGYTGGEPAERIRDLQCGSPFKLRLLGTIEGNQAAERALHKRFAEHRLHGEWFRPCREIRELVRPRPAAVRVVDRPILPGRRMPAGRWWPLASRLVPLLNEHPARWFAVREIRTKLGIPAERATLVGLCLSQLTRHGWAEKGFRDDGARRGAVWRMRGGARCP